MHKQPNIHRNAVVEDSKHPGARSTTTHEATAPCEAIPAKQAAALCCVSERHWWALNSGGRTPRAVKLGRSVRWIRSELLEWLRSGCPARDRWEAMKRTSK